MSLGIDARTRSSATGQYELRDLPAGTYVLSVNMPCCEFEPFVNDDVVGGDGETHQFDILLATAELNIEGGDPATVNAQLLSRQIIPDLPVPRTAAGRLDLSGVWLTSFDLYPEEPKALPWATELFEERIANSMIDHPHTRCLPGTPVVDGAAAFINKFAQTPDLLLILLEGAPGFRARERDLTGAVRSVTLSTGERLFGAEDESR